MLSHLNIKNFILLKDVSFPLHPTLNVFTGETGAGKSMLMDAIRFVLGKKVARLQQNKEKQGNEDIHVSAVFHAVPPFLADVLAENTITLEEDTLILRRHLTQQRSRAFINDTPVTLAFLQRVGEMLMDIHGQDDGLLHPRNHRSLLDAFCKQDLIDKVRHAYTLWKELRHTFMDEEKRLTQMSEDKPFLEKTLKALEEFDPQEKEESLLIEKRKTLFHHQKISDMLQKALMPLSHGGLINGLYGCEEALQEVVTHLEEAKPSLSAIKQSIVELQEASYTLEKLYQNLHHSPEALHQVDERLHSLRAWAKRLGCFGDEVFMRFKSIHHQLSTMDELAQSVEELRKKEQKAFHDYVEVSKQLSKERLLQATHLSKALTHELKGLHLNKATCHVSVLPLVPDQWTQYGQDHVVFLASMNGEEEGKHLHTCASGGERSRVMLALRSLMSHTFNIPILIFDEIDTGVGGAVATAMGKRMKELSKHMQVLSITHSPQVAVYGDGHYFLEKNNESKEEELETSSHVRLLEEKERLQEISRMLSGDKITPEAEAAARRLLLEYGPSHCVSEHIEPVVS
jgi:DNA repair protein RecN (Recombination protein N)